MTTRQTPLTSGQFFTNPTPGNTTPATPPSQSTLGWMASGAQSLFFSPVRGASAEGAQGIANRLAELFNANQPEITERVRDIFVNALVRRAPDNYYQLLHHIQAFQRNPSKVDLDQINLLLSRLDEAGIRSLAPKINQQGVDALTTLADILDTEITENPPAGTGLSPTLTVNAPATQGLQVAEAVLKAIIEHYEGGLIQTMAALTLSMSAPDGPLNALRDQLNHPQHGILAGSLALLRTQLTSRAVPQLREAKTAFDAYRDALNRTANAQELLPLLQTLQAKIALLLARRDLAPQIENSQWPLIEQFDLLIQTQIANSSALPAQPQLLSEAEAASQLIATAFIAQRGMVEEAADILVEGIGRGVEHLVPLPGRMLQGILSPQTPPAQPTTGGTTQPVPPPITSTPIPSLSIPALPIPALLNVGNLASQGRGFLDSILASAGGAISQQAASSLATLVKFTFEKIRGHVQQDAAHAHLLNTIDPMILRLQTAMTDSSWELLTGVLQDAFQFMQAQQVYLQGMRLPLNPVRSHVSAIPGFLNAINAHQNALQPPSQQNPRLVTHAMIDRQADLLKVRSASYGPARLVAEKICDFDGSPAFYADIYRPSSDPLDNDLSPIFRQRLFEKIDQADLNFLRKWFAKRTYDLIHPLSRFYLHSIIGGILKQASNWIGSNPSSQESKDEFLIKLLRNWMAVMSGAYNQVANTPFSQSKDFSTMMEEALKIPERNGGLTQQGLYAAVGKTALDSFGPRISWSETIDNYFSTEIPSHSPLFFLNPVAKALNIFCSYCLKGIVFAPQWLGNQVLQAGAKLALTHTPFLKDYSEQTIESLRRNTPSSYAIQRMIFRQQQKVLQLLQNSLNDDTPSGGLLNRNTNIKKVEITGLVEYALEILNKGQYHTQDRLQNYLNNRASLRDRAGNELENTFLPDIMETAVSTISVAIQAMTEEEEMQQMVHDGLQIANDAFDAKQPVSDEEFAAVEKGIREMTDQILETAIFHAIGEKFDFTNEKQKRGITQFTTALKDQTSCLSTQLGPLAQELASGVPITAPTLQSKISAMIEASAKYNRDRVDALGMADGNRNFHTETKSHFNDLSQQLLTYSNPLSERLNTMKGQADEMLFFDKLLQPLLLCHQIQLSLREKLQSSQLSPDDLAFSKLQVYLLRQHLTTLRRNQCPAPLVDEIQRSCQEFSTALDSIETLQKADVILRQANFLFMRLKSEKLAGIGSPPSAELKNRERQLCDLLNTLPFSDQKTQLNGLVLSMMLASRPEGVNSAAAQFSSTHFEICVRNFSEVNRQMEALRRTRESFQGRLALSIQEYSHLYVQNKTSVQHHAAEVRIEVAELDRWAQNQHDLPIWNLFAFDMQWVKETVKNLAFDRSRAKIQQLFDALYQRHNYVGFMNQVALLPFLEKFGKHHLKK